MKELFERVRVIPVLIFPKPEFAAPTAAALIAGGLSVLEVTLRTDTAWQSLAEIIARHPEATVGVGTVLETEQMIRAKEAGAAFAVSPGFDPALADVAREQGLFYLPGVATASEVMMARRAGFRFVKFFPAEAAGGTAMLQSFASPFRDMAFCPTGGVGAGNFESYLALPNVVCVGGSWVAGAKDMEQGDWQDMTARARATTG